MLGDGTILDISGDQFNPVLRPTNRLPKVSMGAPGHPPFKAYQLDPEAPPRRNPGHRVMSYAAAHAWEKQAEARGVSAVARSDRGFMRAYQRAGGWAHLSSWWKRRRDGFLARHIAQAMRGENIWEKSSKGVWRPTRRSLAMIMWAFMPPRKPAGCRLGVW
jgi:hypothetical protein